MKGMPSLSHHYRALSSLLPPGNVSYLSSPSRTSCYLSKYGHSSVSPSLILHPTSESSLLESVSYLTTHSIPTVIQSGNTSLVGSAVPSSPSTAILSMKSYPQYMDINETEGTMTLSSSVPLHLARSSALSHGFIYPLNISSEGTCLAGGNISTNAGGSYYRRYGSLRSNLLGLRSVIPRNGGTKLDLMRRDVGKSSLGFDLKDLFIGSEGTLGVVTDLRVRLHRMPETHTREVCVVKVLGWENVVTLSTEIEKGLAGLVSAVEIMDQGVVDLVAEFNGRMGMGMGMGMGSFQEDRGSNSNNDPDAYYVLIETMGSTPSHDLDRLIDFVGSLSSSSVVSDCAIANSQRQIQEMWDVREACNPAVVAAVRKFANNDEGSKGEKKEMAWKYDLTVPIEKWIDVVNFVRGRIGNKGKLVIWGHLLDRNIHVNVISLSPIHNEYINSALEPGIYDITNEFKGAISAEHGVGKQKNHMLKRAVTEEVIDVMREIKNVFDPKGIFGEGLLKKGE